MTATAIAAFFPSVMSKAIFAPRRADKSLDANAAPAGAIYAGVAALQTAKICEGISAIKNEGKAVVEGVAKTEQTLQGLAASTSIFDDVKKAGKACVKHANINGLIGAGALVNALYDENPDAALIQNGAMFGSMLLGEGAHKLLLGTSKSARENGVNIIKVDEGFLYKNNENYRNAVNKFSGFCEKQAKAMQDCGEVKKWFGKALKYLPSAIKGLSFAGVSIGVSACGYWGGGKIAKAVTGKEAGKQNQAKIVDMNTSPKAEEVSLKPSYRETV